MKSIEQSRLRNVLDKGSKYLGNRTSVRLRDYSLYAALYPAGDCIMRVIEVNIRELITLSGCGNSGVDYCYDKIMYRRDKHHRRGLYKIATILRGGSNMSLMQFMVYGFVFGVSIGDLCDPNFHWSWGVDFELGELYRSLRNDEIGVVKGNGEFVRCSLLGGDVTLSEYRSGGLGEGRYDVDDEGQISREIE